jgi:DNA polymerase (family 10)
VPSYKTKMPLANAQALADELVKILKKNGARRIEVCGSIRRKLPEVGDIDLVVDTDLPATVLLLSRNRNVEVLTNNVKKSASFLYKGAQVNMYFSTEENWGAMVLFLTGSKLFNIIMRGEAKKQGYKLNQYGLWHGETIIAGKDEAQIFFVLNLKEVNPEAREINNLNKKPGEVLKVLVQER